MLKKLCFLFVMATATSMAATIAFYANLTGALESPANSSPGYGTGRVVFDDVLHQMTININFSGLSTLPAGTTGTTAAHIHCCTAIAGTGNAGVATTTPNFAGFPLNVFSGAFSATLDMTLATSYNAAFVTAQGSIAAAEAALIAGAVAGKDYLNIHTSAFSGGEIRGFLAPIPEPGTFGMLGGALAAAALLRRRFRA